MKKINFYPKNINQKYFSHPLSYIFSGFIKNLKIDTPSFNDDIFSLKNDYKLIKKDFSNAIHKLNLDL